MPSWMRAPPESFRPMQGAPLRMAMSWTLQIFSLMVLDREPPLTVKSWANTYTRRPPMVPQPVTTPSPSGCEASMPKLVQRCCTNMSYSSKLPGSSSISRRSRAVFLPLACCASMRFSPPPRRALARRWTSFSILSVWILINISYLNILSTSFTASGRANTATRS